MFAVRFVIITTDHPTAEVIRLGYDAHDNLVFIDSTPRKMERGA